MIRPLLAGFLVSLAASSSVLAQTCTGNPVAVQILGSGAPGFVKDSEHLRSIRQDYDGHIFGVLLTRRGFWPCVMDHPHEWLA